MSTYTYGESLSKFYSHKHSNKGVWNHNALYKVLHANISSATTTTTKSRYNSP
jgi:hypothetical protein